MVLFKHECSGMPENQETHLLRTTDWVDTHNFAANQTVRRFPLTLPGKA